MAREKNQHRTKKVHPSISVRVHGYLDQLVSLGMGKNKTDVSHYLIMRGIDDLIRASVIKTEDKAD